VLGREVPAAGEPEDAALQGRALDLFHELAGGDVAVERRLTDAYHHAYLRRAAAVEPYRGARDALIALRRLGLRLAVVTSKSRRRLDHDLARTGLAPLLDASVAGDEVRHGKPDAEPISAGLVAIGAPAAAAMYVGDSPVDVASARAAGVYSVGVTFGFLPRALREAEPDLLIDSYDELVAALAA
jgi:phosphoglycolate phosphatase